VTDAPQPTSGSLSMKIIRACRQHADCPLDCPDRRTLDLGVVANFDHRSPMQRIKEALRGITRPERR